MRRAERFIEIDAPVERVFDLFSDFESFPRWMRGVREVRRAGRRLTHWVARTAVRGLDVEWDAETTVFEPDRRIAWRSVRGDVRTDGEAVFVETHEGTTLVRVVVGYATPGGRSGAEAARFFGRHPAHQLEEDLFNFKRLAESEGARRATLRAADERRARRFAEGMREQRRFEDEPRARRPPDERASRRDVGAEFIPRYALTPRERERERGLEGRHFDEGVAEKFRRRGVERLLDEKPRGGRRRTRERD